MEVDLHRIPALMSNGKLKDQLTPLIKALRIASFECRKPRNANYGSITFATEADGERFLAKHGSVDLKDRYGRVMMLRDNKPRQQSRLKLLNTNVFCSRAKRRPAKITVKAIQYDAETQKAQNQWLERQAARNDDSVDREATVVFRVLKLGCGYIGYPSGQCRFVSEISYPQLSLGEEPAVAKFARSSLIIKLNDGFRIDVPFSGISEVLADLADSSLTLILIEVPRFFVNVDGDRTRIPALDDMHSNLGGPAVAYRIWAQSSDFVERMHRLGSRRFLSEAITTSPHLIRAMDAPPFSRLGTLLSEFNSRLLLERKYGMPFDVLFQVQVLVWNGYLLPGTVMKLLDEFKRRRNTPKMISSAAIKQLLSNIPYPSPNVDPYSLDYAEIINKLDTIEAGLRSKSSIAFETLKSDGNEEKVLIYKALVTPSSIQLSGPDLEAPNRVLRKYPKHTDHFVRVQFGEEDGSDLRYHPRVNNDTVYQRFKKVLRDGIMIGGRQYTFFAFSHSSLRSHSTWFNAPFTHDNTLQAYMIMIKALGDFSHIRVVARCAARIGQAFSETPYAVPMKKNGIRYRYIPDLKSKDGSRVFSDGVGSLSPEAMHAIWGSLPPSVGTTAFQIRFGGSKGMLSLDPTLAGRGKEICIRKESMEKFESKDMDNLEICGMANRPIKLHLNRQNIKILEDMGVHGDWFLGLQKVELDRLRGATKNVFNTAVFMAQQSCGESIEFPKFLKRLNRLNIDFKTDKLLCNIVEAVVLEQLRLLKHKARIPVSAGITLYGIVDETSFLEEDEIYITFDTCDGRYLEPPYNGMQVMVTRSPALHPGDVQIARNRIPPGSHPLRQLQNCIVFSQKGERDLPSMLSGGDLDGDMYHVVWDQKVFEAARDGNMHTYEAADYSRPQLQDIGREVEKDDMADFFIDFMKTDQLGLISVRHMIVADQADKGSLDEDCITLAELASAAVDFSKTGIPVDGEKLKSVRVNRARPDFLATAPDVELNDLEAIKFGDAAPIPENDDDEDVGGTFQYYKSDKILGRLFRAVDERKIWHEDVIPQLKKHPDRMWAQLQGSVARATELYRLHWTHLLGRADEIRTLYDDAVAQALVENGESPFKPLSETELFVGKVFNKRGSMTRRQRESSDKIRTAFDSLSSSIWKMIRERPGDENEPVAGSSTDNVADKSVLELALACFHVSMERRKGLGVRHQGMMIETFKILAANVFLKELEMYQRAEEASVVNDIMAGGYVGVSSGRVRRSRPRPPQGDGTRSRPIVVGGHELPLRTAGSVSGSASGSVRAGSSSKPMPAYMLSLESSLKMIPPQIDLT